MCVCKMREGEDFRLFARGAQHSKLCYALPYLFENTVNKYSESMIQKYNHRICMLIMTKDFFQLNLIVWQVIYLNVFLNICPFIVCILPMKMYMYN